MRKIRYYNEKYIVSGNIVEYYHYEKTIFTGFENKGNSGRKKNSVTDEKQKEKNRQLSANRSRKAVRRFVNANIVDTSKFVTLTFKNDVRELKDANYEFKKFKQRLEYKLDIRLKYLCVPEFTKKGRVHYHIVFFNLPYINNKDLKEIWRNGFIKINKIDNCDNVGAYVSKYMTKDNEKLVEEKSYFCSRNLKKPVEITKKEEVKVLSDSLPLPTYTNFFVSEHLGVINYKQYNLNDEKNQQTYKKT